MDIGDCLTQHYSIKKGYQSCTMQKSKIILDKIDNLLKAKPDCLLVYVGTNDLTNNVDLLNLVKKWSKK